MQNKIQKTILDVIHGRRSAPIIKGLLLFCASLFKRAILLRNYAYDKKILKITKASLPVVSIGNIAVGGTGKTPLIHLLASQLSASSVAILTRGYRGEKLDKPTRIDLAAPNAKKFGDEPTWLAAQLPKASVWVGRDRKRSAELAHREGAKLLLLDDGMQHRALARDIEIVLLDGKDLFAKGAFLPRGLLRDSPKRLKDADLIVLNHIRSEEEYKACLKQLAPYTSAPVCAIRYRFKDEEQLKGVRLGAFCAIGAPEHFFENLRAAGADVVESFTALDHQPFDQKELELFGARCKAKGAELLVCTEKDAIKFSSSPELCLPVKSLGVEIEWTAGAFHWKECLNKINSMVRAHE